MKKILWDRTVLLWLLLLLVTKFVIIWFDFSIKLAIRVNLHQYDFPLSLHKDMWHIHYTWMLFDEVYCCEKTPERPISLNKITKWYNLNRISESISASGQKISSHSSLHHLLSFFLFRSLFYTIPCQRNHIKPTKFNLMCAKFNYSWMIKIE